MVDDLCCKAETVSGKKPSKWRFTWLMNLLLFAFFQIVFILFDGSKIWIILGLNKKGEWVVSKLHMLFDKFPMYHTEQLNYFTFVWIVILILHGIVCTFEKLSQKFNNARNQ